MEEFVCLHFTTCSLGFCIFGVFLQDKKTKQNVQSFVKQWPDAKIFFGKAIVASVFSVFLLCKKTKSKKTKPMACGNFSSATMSFIFYLNFYKIKFKSKYKKFC